MTKLPALAVDVQGLAKLVERRGKSFAVLELVQNAWDESTTRVDVELQYEGYNKARLVVTDDSPDGFHDLSHAYTLFADSKKKADPEKRGRFNLGEKLVIALADNFGVYTTTGAVEINVKENERHVLRKTREQGSMVFATIRMTRGEVADALNVVDTLLVPSNIETYVNGTRLLKRKPIHTFEATLQTETADDEGYLRPTRRKTTVEIYEPLFGEQASIYELGLPVVATGDRYHVNVLQKVPLNSDRDNVTPAYLRDVRALVLNATHLMISNEDAADNWVNEALADDLVTDEAVTAVLTKRFGEKRVIFDPSDPEANKLAMSQGYTVIPGRALSGDAWKNVKRFEAVKPAGQVTPSPKPFSPDGDPLDLIPEEKWTPGMKRVAKFAKDAAEHVLDRKAVRVIFTADVTWPHAAAYGPSGDLYLNKGRLGGAWFEAGITTEVIDLVIHEYGHEYEGDHLSERYFRALTKVGAKMTKLALEKPEIFA